MTQAKRVIEYLDSHGSITQKEAFEELGILRLAQVIRVLKNTGVRIISVRESGKNRFGETSWYARYMYDEVN